MEAIKFNVKNIIYTIPGERTFDADFGVGIRRFLFEMPTPDLASNIKALIIDQMETYAPYIDVNQINVSFSNDTQTLRVMLSYNIPQVNVFDNLEIKVS